MLKEKEAVIFYKSAQQELNELWPLYKALKAQRKYYDADQVKHRIKLLKKRVKHGR